MQPLTAESSFIVTDHIVGLPTPRRLGGQAIDKILGFFHIAHPSVILESQVAGGVPRVVACSVALKITTTLANPI